MSAGLVAAVSVAIWLLEPHVPGAQPRRALPLRGPAGRGLLGARPTRWSVSVASMLAFNFFFLPPLHTFTLAGLAATGSRSASSSSPRSSSASSRRARGGGRPSRRCWPRSRPRCSSAATSAPSSTGSPPRPPSALQVEQARDRARRSAAATGPGERYPLLAGGRRVGTIYLESPRPGSAAAAGGSSPRWLAARSRDRPRAARTRGARGRGAAAQRRDQDGRPAGGQPRPAHAADGDPDVRERARSRGPRARASDDERELVATILGEAERLDRLVGNLLDLSRLRRARPQPEPGVWAVDDSSLQALERDRRGRRAGRGRAAGRARSRCGSTPSRSSACSST